MNAKLVVIAPLLWALASAPLAFGQTKGANLPDQKRTVAAAASSTKRDARPIKDLRLAAQRLRDAIHEMIREPAGVKRNELVKAGDRALTQVQGAMVNRPPEMLTAKATESHYRVASDQPQKATQNLHEAARALAQDPNSQRHDETMKKTKTVVQETHRLTHNFPRGASGA